MTPLQCLERFVTENPVQAGILLGGITVVAIPGALLGALGFGAGGVGAGSLFAILQSAGTGKSFPGYYQSCRGGGDFRACVHPRAMHRRQWYGNMSIEAKS
ncbi:uncharacterized protein TRIREDRAFT_104907, partial [Trichoderma reesei QM6a]